jgi:hypothetical protein
MLPDLPTNLPLSSIIFGDRARKDYQGIEKLAESIQLDGLIQPIILSATDFSLVAGGRRYHAIKTLDPAAVFYHGVSSTPGTYGFLWAHELDPVKQWRLEFAENFNRQDFHWLEAARLMVRIHNTATAEAALAHSDWSTAQTATLMDPKGSVRRTHVQHAIKVIEAVDAVVGGDKELIAAPSLAAAVKILLERKTAEAVARLVGNPSTPHVGGFTAADSRPSNPLADPSNWVVTDSSKPVSGPNPAATNVLDELDGEAPAKPTVAITEPAKPEVRVINQVEIPLSRLLYKGHAVDEIIPAFIKQGLTVKHIITDPPYGIDMDNLDENKGVKFVVDEHDVDENLTLIEAFLPLAFQLLAETGFLIMWYDLDHHEKIRDWGTKAGFKVTRWPLIWQKLHPNRNQAPQYNPTKRTEVAMLMRKGNATLIKPVPSNVYTCDGLTERKMFDNPFAKPAELWKWLFEMVCLPGDTVCDPFMGGGSMPRAAANFGLRPIGMEKKELHFNRAVELMKETYLGITHGKAVFT